jgi:hypothetical protein
MPDPPGISRHVATSEAAPREPTRYNQLLSCRKHIYNFGISEAVADIKKNSY